jgi:hypothetical protein
MLMMDTTRRSIPRMDTEDTNTANSDADEHVSTTTTMLHDAYVIARRKIRMAFIE